ncbi:Aminodeoxychorismate lyase [Diaporthe australafricana]|uniref:Aminodeoxychorismate lyase n=1 Tax=Diaporthe australafricana TaxID=127596 RepID=A0ABR3XFT0_9PEZI
MGEDFKLFTSLRFDPILLQLGDSQPIGVNGGWNAIKPSPFYMLDYHRDRMLKAASHWGWSEAVAAIEGSEGLARLESFILGQLGQDASSRPMRVKVLLSREGRLGLESSVVPATSLANLFPKRLVGPEDSNPAGHGEPLLGQLELSPPYGIHLDDRSTRRSEYTHYKTTKREMYDQARTRAGLKPTDATREVLIVDEATGSIMEGSLTTPYFLRGGRWVTPPVAEKFSTDDGSGGQDGTTRRWALEQGLAVEEEVNAKDIVDGEAVWLSNGVRGFVFGKIRTSEE